jgi:hypothetical protein
MGFVETPTQLAAGMDLSTKATVIALEPSGHLSDKYTMVSTQKVLDTFSSLGWQPVGYQEKRVRVEERRGKQLHTVVLANEELNRGLMVSETLPRIMLKNSHDGTGSLQILSGLFERICANGLIVGARASDIRLRHLSLSEDLIAKGISTAVTSLEDALKISEKMRARSLDQRERLSIAQEVIEMAWDNGQYTISPDALLWNHRREQNVPNLWNTFNTIQERVIRGGVRQYRKEGGGSIRSREVKSIDRSIALNRGMWDIAERWV